MIGGLAAYVLVVLVQGIGFGELLKAWRPGDDMVSRLAIALGVGICSSGVSMFFFTSGMSVFGIKLLGIGAVAVYLPSGVGLAALFASVALRRRFSFPRRPTWGECLVVGLMAVQCIMLIQYFGQFPYFQQYPSADFMQHFSIARGLLAGQTASIPAGILYFGVHYQIGLAMFFSGVDPNVARYTVALLAVFSTPLFYLAMVRILKNRTGACVGTAIYTLTATVWFGNLFNSGLYPQFYAIASILFLLAAAAPLLDQPLQRASLPLFLLAVANAYISHYSVLVILPALCVMPIVSLAKSRKEWKTWLLFLLVFAAPSVLGLLLFPATTNAILSILNPASASQSVLGTTPLATLLSPIPVVSYMVVDVTDDVGAVVVIVLAVLSLVQLRKADDTISFFPAIFLGVILVIAPFNPVAWRFSFDGLVFLTMLAGMGVALLIPRSESRKRRIVGLSIAFLCLGGVFVGSWGQQMFEPNPQSAQLQGYVYSAIGWLKDNTPATSVYYSVTDWRFTYMNIAFQRPVVYRYVSDPLQVVEVAEQVRVDYSSLVPNVPAINFTTYYLHPTYIIVTNFVTETLPASPSYYPWDTFTASANATLVYSNSDVRIYSLAPLPSCVQISQLSYQCPLQPGP